MKLMIARIAAGLAGVTLVATVTLLPAPDQSWNSQAPTPQRQLVAAGSPLEGIPPPAPDAGVPPPAPDHSWNS